ncbi:unnamed protein product [Menidia menidia]|uniref:(Atlantic silverside) hypothetical protein n=1 Tax=Menidia menidia TaxID=238744 RepID=A0A8S4ALQ5_9TELE|nr:unnamed protein product [Menidia menidia]
MIYHKKFKRLLGSTVDGVLDLNSVCQELSVSKRRVYDVTNVLEGINLIQKKSKNQIQWMGRQLNVGLNGELRALKEKEKNLDELIESCTGQIQNLCEDKRSSFPRYLSNEVSTAPLLLGGGAGVDFALPAGRQSKDLLRISGISVGSVQGACSEDERRISLCWWWPE